MKEHVSADIGDQKIQESIRIIEDLLERKELGQNDRNSWDGIRAIQEYYEASVGPDRESVITALGQVIETNTNPQIIASLLLVANTLDITQIEENIIKVRERELFRNRSVRREFNNYFAYRNRTPPRRKIK